MAHEDEKYWYNLGSGEVEKGYASPAVDRVGPFDTAEEARRAPELLKERARAWAEDDKREDAWGSTTGSAPDDKA
ncbi:SPOR domain-containing protein [Microbacterium sp. LRZ72]|uniref:SPOR domain-containing protein n=1 Tax=Microbacterium sp. LRZ72 TaxID=2942481 RepID=UPI00299FDA40|nr:SPOR domain-containing protein [Microbacterium sp. LRZ72]MDX2375319.1 SPOR domain-containing protein [Microbacterium sp. LRZ72]